MQLVALHGHVMQDSLVLLDATRAVLPEKLPPEYAGRSIYFASLLKRLNACTLPLGVYNTMVEDVSMTPNEVKMTAEWRPYRTRVRKGQNADIRIRWHVHPLARRWVVTPTSWRHRRFYFWSFLMHELVHRHQDAARRKNTTSLVFKPAAEEKNLRAEQTYLGDFDEVEAYAHDIALEMVVWFPAMRYREAFQHMKTFHHRRITATYPGYAGVFGETPTHPAMRALRRKIHVWYRIMDQHRDTYQTLGLEPL